MATERPLKIAVIAGEESGDLLGADLVRALSKATGREVRLVGVGGRHLEALGLSSLFDANEIALMGVSAVLRGLPRLMLRIGQAAKAIAAEAPDCLVTIDSPDFSLRVAKKVRVAAPDMPIIHYVCPSVWAWRPGRAVAMAQFVDHVLCILPFEVEALKRLKGPAGTYVGHRLAHEAGVLKAAEAQAAPRDLSNERVKTLLLLPGSRNGEVSRLLEPFGKTVSILKARGHRLRLILPTVPHVAEQVRQRVTAWDQQPEIVLEPERKWQAYGRADAALIASGTVSLELALSGVPMMSTYILDAGARVLQRFVPIWSGLLPNLIADRPVVPEVYNEYVRPQSLARYIEALWSDSGMRRWQIDGFEEVRRRMRTDRPAGELAAEVVLKTIRKRAAGGKSI
jgi:lipid-A-disaccharide synthase